jgi:osmotically-inducible protein OsmY
MRKFLWLILISFFLLTACGTTPDDANAAAQLAKVERRSPETIATDKAIEQKAFEEFHDDFDILTQSHVNVNAYNGLALVTGEVTSEELKNKIMEIVRVIPHVKMVRDSLTLGSLSQGDSRTNDQILTGKVQKSLTQIQTLPDFKSSMIKVVTEDGVVYLMGLVSKEEGNVVVNVTRLQAGVKQIVTVFEYTN